MPRLHRAYRYGQTLAKTAPPSSRRNLLNWSTDFSQGAWAKQAGYSLNGNDKISWLNPPQYAVLLREEWVVALPNTIYTVSIALQGSGVLQLYAFGVDNAFGNGTTEGITASLSLDGSSQVLSVTFTTRPTTTRLSYRLWVLSSASNFTAQKPQLELGSVRTEHQATNGTGII